MADTWREQIAWLKKEQAAGRPGGCRYDF